MAPLPEPGVLTSAFDAACEAAGVTGGVLAVERAGERVVVASGRRDAGAGTAMTADTQVPLLSVVKPMTAWLVVRAAAEGRLGLDQPAADLVGAPLPRDLTVRHLLTMTSGLPEVALEPPGGTDEHAAVTHLLASLPPAEPPGAVWSYSNAAFAVLGHGLEVVHGAPWKDVVREQLFAPLGMTAGFLDEATDLPVAAEHVSDGDPGSHRVVPGLAMRCFGAAGTLVRASAADVLAFAAVLRSAEAAPLRQAHVEVPVRIMADRWCLGLGRFDWPGGSAWGWDGIGVGVRNVLRVVPDRDLAVVLLTTGDRGRLLLRSFVPALLDELADLGAPPLRLTPTDEVVPLEPYVGVYEREGLPPARVRLEDGALVVVDLRGEQRLSALDRRTFLADATDPDGPTVSFDDFDEHGAPRLFYRLGFALSRVG